MGCKRKHTKISHLIPFLSLVLICGLFFMLDTGQVHAAGKTVKFKDLVIAEENEKGEMVYIPYTSKEWYRGSSPSNVNYHALTMLIKGNKKKTIVIPSGSKFQVNGVLIPGNNTTIIADGATIIGKKKSNLITCKPGQKLKNLTIKGGTWRSPDKGGRVGGGIFAFSFVDGLVIDGVDCNANYHGHSIEIIACKNVTIQNCKISAIGKCPKNPKTCLEAQLQIDIATKSTAPKVAEYGKKYVQGQTCENVKILNNTVTGARAVELNWTNSEGGKYKNKFHKNIVIKGNTITGTSSEALAFFNVIGGEISGNTIKTKSTRTQANGSYTIGVHVAAMGKHKSLAKSKLVIKNNTIYGNRNGIHFKGLFNKNETKCLQKLGKITVSGNKVYCKKGKDQAIVQVKKSCTKLTQSKNKTYKWK